MASILPVSERWTELIGFDQLTVSERAGSRDMRTERRPRIRQVRPIGSPRTVPMASPSENRPSYKARPDDAARDREAPPAAPGLPVSRHLPRRSPGSARRRPCAAMACKFGPFERAVTRDVGVDDAGERQGVELPGQRRAPATLETSSQPCGRDPAVARVEPQEQPARDRPRPSGRTSPGSRSACVPTTTRSRPASSQAAIVASSRMPAAELAGHLDPRRRSARPPRR